MVRCHLVQRSLVMTDTTRMDLGIYGTMREDILQIGNFFETQILDKNATFNEDRFRFGANLSVPHRVSIIYYLPTPFEILASNFLR